MENLKFSAVAFQCFSKEQVKKINKEIKKNLFHKEPQTEAAKNAFKIGDFFHIPCSPLMKLLHPWLYECQLINKKNFGYDINWDFHIETLNYNIYEKNGEYGWHIDANEKSLYLKQHATNPVNWFPWSEEALDSAKKEKKFTTGMGLIINSLIAHKVTPVTKGERITLSYWAHGPTWR